MDMLPKVGGVDPYHGGASQQRPGTGAFARKKKEEDERRRRSEAAGTDDDARFEIDPLLAEMDRLRALDPILTESGAHRAVLALRAYQHSPGEIIPTDDAPAVDNGAPAADAAAPTRTIARPPATPPPPSTGSDAPGT